MELFGSLRSEGGYLGILLLAASQKLKAAQQEQEEMIEPECEPVPIAGPDPESVPVPRVLPVPSPPKQGEFGAFH